MPSEFPGRQDAHRETDGEYECEWEGEGERERSVELATFYANCCVRILHFTSLAFSERFNFGIGVNFPMIMCEKGLWLSTLSRSHTRSPSGSDMIMLIR